MGIKQLYNDNLRKLPNEYGDVSVMVIIKRMYVFVFEDHMLDWHSIREVLCSSFKFFSVCSYTSVTVTLCITTALCITASAKQLSGTEYSLFVEY